MGCTPFSAQRFTVIVFGSTGPRELDKPRADYSVFTGGYADRWRNSQRARHRAAPSAILLGGGVAMQFAYQFPQLVDRLILVSAGGVTKDVNIVFPVAAHGSEAMALLRPPLVLPAVNRRADRG